MGGISLWAVGVGQRTVCPEYMDSSARLGHDEVLSLAEGQASRIVAASTNCLCEQLDPGGGPVGLPEFELRDSGQRRIGVLEVTSTIVGERAAFAAAQARNRETDPRLRCDWLIVTVSGELGADPLPAQ